MKPGYKQTEVGVIPEDWEVLRLKDVCQQIQDGTHFTPTYVNSGVPFYSVENVTRNDFQNTKYVSRSDHEAMAKRCRPARGDILMTRITAGKIGDTKLLDWDCDASIYVSLVLLKLGRRVLPEYFYAYTKSSFFVSNVEKRALTNATPKKINLGDIGKIPVPFPNDREEQHAIAAALADVDAMLAELERLISKKRDLKQAAMQQLLTGQTRLPGFSGAWEVTRLGEIAQIVMGQSPASRYYNTAGDGLPLIQGNADIKGRETIKRIFTREVTKLGLAGDLILSIRAPVGEVARTSFNVCLGRGVCAVRSDEPFLFHFLVFKEAAWTTLSKGSTFDSVSGAEIREFRINLPASREERNGIAAILSDMDAELSALQEQLEKTRLIKQAMMQELLTGRTRLPLQRGFDDQPPPFRTQHPEPSRYASDGAGRGGRAGIPLPRRLVEAGWQSGH